jgi:hypothetical protein
MNTVIMDPDKGIHFTSVLFLQQSCPFESLSLIRVNGG